MPSNYASYLLSQGSSLLLCTIFGLFWELPVLIRFLTAYFHPRELLHRFPDLCQMLIILLFLFFHLTVLVGRDRLYIASPIPKSLGMLRTSLIRLQNWREGSLKAPKILLAVVPGGTDWASLGRGCCLGKKIQNWPVGPCWLVCGEQGSAAGTPQTLASPGVISDVLHAHGDGMKKQLCSCLDSSGDVHVLGLGGPECYPPPKPQFWAHLAGPSKQRHCSHAWRSPCWPEYLLLSPVATWSQVPLERRLLQGEISGTLGGVLRSDPRHFWV